MLNPLHSGQNVPSLWEKTNRKHRQKVSARIAHRLHLDQLARDLAQEWNELATGGTEVAGGWQAG